MLNPTGLCLCGCGEQTPLAPVTSKKRGWKKGEPIQYCRGHSMRITNKERRGRSNVEVVAVESGHPSPCLVWQGAVNSKGYPSRGDGTGRGTILAHRAAYEAVHGPLADGLHLHHLCGERRCLEVEHLIALSQRDHNRLHAWLRRDQVAS